MIKIIRCLCFASFFYTATAYPADWYSDFTVAVLHYSIGADGVHIEYTGGSGVPNPDGCDNSNMFYLAYSSTNPDRQKAMLSGLSMAFATHKKLNVYLLGCVSGIGGKTYPNVYYLDVIY